MTTLSPDTLKLDDNSIDPQELSMPVLAREIVLQRRPNWLLVKMMNALEEKRQRKGLVARVEQIWHEHLSFAYLQGRRRRGLS